MKEINWREDVPSSIKAELGDRYDELSRLEQEQTQMGTATPQLYASLSRFVANPSTVSVETYKRMLDTDEQIGSGIDFMNLALIARFGEYTHPVPKIQAFVRRALEQMEGSWHGNLDEMFSAEWSGFSLTEQVWKFDPDFDGAPAFVPKKLVTYPPLTIVFAVDRHGEVLPDGIYQYQRFHNSFFNAYGNGISDMDGFRPDLFASTGDYPYPIRIAADLSYLTVKIPKDKVIHIRSSSTGKFDNPYGRSILRRAYKNWVMKDAFLKMWIVAADRKGTPLVVGYAAPNDTVMQQLQNGNQDDTNIMRTDAAMAKTFKTIHNSSFIVLPGKKGETYDVEAIQVQGDMNVFKDGIDYFNKALMKALLIPPLVMSGGDGAGSYALGESHHKIFGQIIDGKNKAYKQSILSQFISKIIAYNFPRDQWEKHGHGDFVLEEYDPEVMEKLANIYRTLTEVGYMTPDAKQDFQHVREKMGIKKEAKEDTHSDTNSFEDADGDGIPDDEDDSPNGEPSAESKNPMNQPSQSGDAPIPGTEVLNGAQITSLVNLISQAATNAISRESAINIIMKGFKMDRLEAEKILGPADFKSSANKTEENPFEKSDDGDKPDDLNKPEKEEKLPPEYNV